jgi:L-threonylcarbamoyladenylate synthase
MKTEIIRADHPIALTHAVDILNNGGLVSFPTDTVYGLASLPFDANFVERLYVAKGRNSQRAIAVLMGDISQLSMVAEELRPRVLHLAERFWPGPLTLIVPKLPSIPHTLTPTTGIGVRIPNHPVALQLMQLAGPLAVTSANLTGQDNTTTAQEVIDQLRGRIHLVIDGGKTPGGVPSTVIDCMGPEPIILREGPISKESLDAVL